MKLNGVLIMVDIQYIKININLGFVGFLDLVFKIFFYIYVLIGNWEKIKVMMIFCGNGLLCELYVYVDFQEILSVLMLFQYWYNCCINDCFCV